MITSFCAMSASGRFRDGPGEALFPGSMELSCAAPGIMAPGVVIPEPIRGKLHS
jgi:hypothetical protein